MIEYFSRDHKSWLVPKDSSDMTSQSSWQFKKIYLWLWLLLNIFNPLLQKSSSKYSQM